MGSRSAAVVAAAAVALLAGCRDAGAQKPVQSAPTSLVLDVPQSAPAQQTGHLLVQPLIARCGIISITGTHAEFMPKNPLCKVRVRVTSVDTTSHVFETGPQRLVLADGTLVATHPDAMNIKRQPRRVELGAGNAHELDLWFSPPGGSLPTALKAVGDQDEDPVGRSVNTAKNPGGVLLPLAGLAATT